MIHEQVKRETQLILKLFPETREHFNVFLVKYIDEFLHGDYKRLIEISVESYSKRYRHIQNIERRYRGSKKAMDKRKRAQKLFKSEYGK